MGKFISTFTAFFGLVLVFITFTSQATQAQDVASLKEMIESHYKAINTGEGDIVTQQHQPDFTIFSRNGYMLITRDDIETVGNVGISSGGDEDNEGSSANVVPYNFRAQIYDNVGLATFYLWGSYGTGEDRVEGMWRVSAVWIYEDGQWREAHHHESPLIIPGDH